MIYSVPYILLTLAFGIMALYYPKLSDNKYIAKRDIDIVCITLSIIFFGFRGFIGDDWMIYYPYFQNCTFNNLSLNVFSIADDFSYEPGFTLIVLLCKNLFGSYISLNIVCCIINTFLLFKFLKRYVNNIPLGFMLYICMGGFLMSINLMRNTIAILIIANSVHYITQRNWIRYFSMCTLALMFHTSSILYFPLYFFIHHKYNKWIFLAIFITGTAIFISQIKLVTSLLSIVIGMFSDKLELLIETYTNENNLSKGISIGLLERLFTGILIFCYYDKLSKIRKENIIFINCYILYFCFYFFFGEFDVMSSRLANLFTFFYWVIWADLIKVFAIENNKNLFVIFIFIYAVLKVIGLSRFITYEYDNVLFGAKSYNERLYIHENYKYGED